MIGTEVDGDANRPLSSQRTTTLVPEVPKSRPMTTGSDLSGMADADGSDGGASVAPRLAVSVEVGATISFRSIGGTSAGSGAAVAVGSGVSVPLIQEVQLAGERNHCEEVGVACGTNSS